MERSWRDWCSIIWALLSRDDDGEFGLLLVVLDPPTSLLLLPAAVVPAESKSLKLCEHKKGSPTTESGVICRL